MDINKFREIKRVSGVIQWPLTSSSTMINTQAYEQFGLAWLGHNYLYAIDIEPTPPTPLERSKIKTLSLSYGAVYEATLDEVRIPQGQFQRLNQYV